MSVGQHWGRVRRGPHLEGLVGTEHRCDLVAAVGASHTAKLAYQSLAGLAVVGHLFFVIWAHQALGAERAMRQSASGVCKGADLPQSGLVPSLCWPNVGGEEFSWWCSMVPPGGTPWHQGEPFLQAPGISLASPFIYLTEMCGNNKNDGNLSLVLNN